MPRPLPKAFDAISFKVVFCLIYNFIWYRCKSYWILWAFYLDPMVLYLSMHLGPIWILFFELGFIRIIQLLLVSISLLTMNICGFQSDLVGSYLVYIRDSMGCHWVSILDSKGSLWFPFGSCGNPCAIVADPTGLYSAPVPQTPSSYKVFCWV